MFAGGIFALGAVVLMAIGGGAVALEAASSRGRNGWLWAGLAVACAAILYAFGVRLAMDLDEGSAGAAYFLTAMSPLLLTRLGLAGLVFLIHRLPARLPRIAGSVPVFLMGQGGAAGGERELCFGPGGLSIRGGGAGADVDIEYAAIDEAAVDGECLRLAWRPAAGGAAERALFMPRVTTNSRAERVRISTAIARHIRRAADSDVVQRHS
jgi:hypothetical protein